MTRIKVAVRVRPLSNREVETGSVPIVNVEGGRTIAITNTKVPEQNAGDSRERVRRFTFDYCFQEDSTQDHIFEEIEKVIGQSIKRRFHSCVLAYGQSFSGKTHTMMGFPHDPGLTPKLCHRVFSYLQETAVGDEVLDLKVSVSYLEIYNEKVRDLLRKEDTEGTTFKRTQPLKVREHPKKGPYVQGLSEHPVTDCDGLLEWLEIGNSQRSVAATLTNPRSSRSHSVFSISCDGVKLHLIDLAGSERAGSRGYGTSQFREGANINKSLVALGNVISALAEQTAKQTKGLRRKFVPYRDSVLTWLLKDTLGGNSNTVMVATVSPSSACYSETVNTLRFGQRAKLIVSHPVVNEDPKEKTIRELRAEIARLKDLLKLSQLSPQELSMLEDGNSLLTNGKSDEKQSNHKEISGNADIEAEKEINDLQSEVNIENEEIRKNSVSEQLSTSVSNQSLSNDDCVLGDSENLSTETISISEITTERLFPLLNVSTSVKPSRPTKLRRTFSVDHSYINKQREKMFGSEESIPSTSTTSKISQSSSSLEKQKSQGSISRRNPGSATPSSLLRRRSLNKSNPMLPKTPPKRRSLENNSHRIEKSTTTEGLNMKKVEPKVNSIRKQPLKPRSQIVAAVTSRLYSKINRKEAATNTDDLNIQKTQAPKESNPSNAKSRLRDLTRRALRAHRQKNEQTQTDLYAVLRVKEMSTDVDDLKVSLKEVKHAETDTVVIKTKDASVNCTFLDQLSDDEKRHNNISFTRSCGTQSSQEITNASDTIEKENTSSARSTSNPISFTKYLREMQDPKYELSDVIPNAPIYTKTVNINISHNYINDNRSNGSISEDSIEQNPQNGCLPTPDLISNHNSLEQAHDDSEPSESKVRPDVEKINYADTGVLDEYFTVNEGTVPTNDNKKCTATTYTVSPSCGEKIHSVNIEKVQVPEICLTNKFEEGYCKPLPRFVPDMAKPKIVESRYYTCDDCIKLEEPLVLKSIVKQLPKGNILNDNNPSSSDEDIFSSDVPDSLDYHMTNTKKVKFNRKNSKRSPENGRMLNAMSEFLEEATNLMNNLTMAASKIGSNNLQLDDSYEFEVTVNGVSGLGKTHRKKRKASRPISVPKTKQTETTTGFTFPSRSHCSTQCGMDHSFPINKYEALVEESCKRLEEKINKIPSSFQSAHDGEEVDPYFTYNPWQPHSLVNDVEDSSLESNPVTYSDYGSLPRKTHKRHRTPTCSPSAFLKQLTNMRRQIIETSREEFLGGSNNH
ncbi:kinesin-like protein KIF16B [Anoplophora glabripennis]|uniref:kinesin-like protein KIF16B n=1 Tax=Anoplophora glabripennis TaxID=217634 RepID=UPI00087396C9|nr:kinesin-like protein KIF16B [Anoplophora glabripennis]